MHKHIPLSLYIHIPWCEKKCPYCDFNSHAKKTGFDEASYIDALITDFRTDVARFSSAIADREISSIFIGGGTPSLFSAQSFNTLLSALQDSVTFSKDIEITLEANPGSSEADKFNGFRQAGINRLSIGVQSFNPKHLCSLGRVHSPTEAINAATYAKKANFDNVNLDLMFGLPEQTLDQCIDDIQQAIAQQPTHLSCYQLTIEPNTLFYHQPPITPDDEALWTMQTTLQTCLSDANYTQYEVSAYARPNRQCHHNLNYWHFGDYLSIGAGGHGKLTNADMSIQRYWKVKHPAQYLAAAKNNTAALTGKLRTLSVQETPFEFMMNALRLTNGFDLALFHQRTGLDTDLLSTTLQTHQQKGLLNLNDNHVQTTAHGRLFIDEMLQDYLPS